MILVIDTSLSTLRLALFDEGGNALAEFHKTPEPNDRGIHDRHLAEETHVALRKLNAIAKDISRIAYISGPGTFTGLRIGLAFVKGMSYGLECPVMPMTAHELMKYEYEKLFGRGSDVRFLYPGYEKNSVYAACGEDIATIAFIKAEAAETLHKEKTAGHSSLHALFPNMQPLTLPLNLLAECANNTANLIPPTSIGDLEPFYGTDFKVV